MVVSKQELKGMVVGQHTRIDSIAETGYAVRRVRFQGQRMTWRVRSYMPVLRAVHRSDGEYHA